LLDECGGCSCKLAIEAQGGTIGVDPGMPVGSTFWFELPA
jgi:signal transduction histidine kinase